MRNDSNISSGNAQQNIVYAVEQTWAKIWRLGREMPKPEAHLHLRATQHICLGKHARTLTLLVNTYDELSIHEYTFGIITYASSLTLCFHYVVCFIRQTNHAL